MPEKNNNKPISFFQMLFKGSMIHNPVLVQVIGICPVIAAAVSFKAGALLAGVYSVILIVTQWIACAFLKNVPRWIRMAVYLLIGLIVACPVMYILDKYALSVRISVGIYLPLLAVNSLAALRCEKFAVKNSLRLSFFDSIAASIGYSAVLIITGLIRELLGSGKIAGRSIFSSPTASGFLMPFGGFMVLGFTAALLKWFVHRFYPHYEKEMIFELTKLTVNDKFSSGTDSRATSKVHFGRSKKLYTPELPKPEQEDSPEGGQAESITDEIPAQPIIESKENQPEESAQAVSADSDDVSDEDTARFYDDEVPFDQDFSADDLEIDINSPSVEQRLQEILNSLMGDEGALEDDEKEED